MKSDAEEGWSKRTLGMWVGTGKMEAYPEMELRVVRFAFKKNCFVDGDHHSDTVSVYIYRC